MKLISVSLMFFLLLIAPCSVLTGEIDQFLGSRSVVGQIFFSKGGSQLSIAQKQSLKDLSQRLQKQDSVDRLIRVEGFSSPDGAESLNYDLSMQRAINVQSFLKHQNLPTELFLMGQGEKNASTAKLSEQRRVDIAIYQETRAVKQLFHGSGRIERFVIQ